VAVVVVVVLAMIPVVVVVVVAVVVVAVVVVAVVVVAVVVVAVVVVAVVVVAVVVVVVVVVAVVVVVVVVWWWWPVRKRNAMNATSTCSLPLAPAHYCWSEAARENKRPMFGKDDSTKLAMGLVTRVLARQQPGLQLRRSK
jgi:hypothetical protein